MRGNELSVWLMPQEVTFSPRNVYEEVLQNVRTIFATAVYSVPLDRELGIDATIVDEPVNTVRQKLSGRIVKALRKYEPRADVRRIEYEYNADMDKVIPRIYLYIRSEP